MLYVGRVSQQLMFSGCVKTTTITKKTHKKTKNHKTNLHDDRGCNREVCDSTIWLLEAIQNGACPWPLKELVMWAFFTFFVFTGWNKETETGVEGGQTTEQGGLCSSMPVAVTLENTHPHICICTCTCTHTGLLACTCFTGRERRRLKGEAEGDRMVWGQR